MYMHTRIYIRSVNRPLVQLSFNNNTSVVTHCTHFQFVHRYVAFANSSARACGAACPHRLVRAIAANAGSYTLPSFHERFPFGFGGLEARVSAHDLAAFVRCTYVYI